MVPWDAQLDRCFMQVYVRDLELEVVAVSGRSKRGFGRSAARQRKLRSVPVRCFSKSGHYNFSTWEVFFTPYMTAWGRRQVAQRRRCLPPALSNEPAKFEAMAVHRHTGAPNMGTWAFRVGLVGRSRWFL